MASTRKNKSQTAFNKQSKPFYVSQKNKYQGRRFVVTLHGAKPDNCPYLELLKKQFQKGLYTVVAVAYQTGVHGIHPHWQIYLQVEPRVSNMKTLLTTALEGSGKEEALHIEVAKSTRSDCLNYVYAVGKQHELGWVQYAKGHTPPLRYDPRGTQNLTWLHYNMKPWQKEITERVTSPSDFRDILYIYEPVGNTGKTYLTKYLHYFHGAIVTGGKVADMKYAISRWKQITGAYPVIIIFDVARSAILRKAAYYAIQQMKNSMFFSGKYDSGMVASKQPPHILVFANRPPETKWLSQDRWVIKYIDPETQSLALPSPQ